MTPTAPAGLAKPLIRGYNPNPNPLTLTLTLTLTQYLAQLNRETF